MSKLSPMMQQYLNIKASHKDHVLFFRLGDFYEMFFEDAETISKELELTLTGKECGLPERAPMCGIPYHSAEGYIKKLIDRGFKVAICEQTEDPSKAKGLVKREVTRVITPGTVIEGSLLEDAKNNYIASFYATPKAFSVCFADISTGEVLLTEQRTKNPAADIQTELQKFMPSEVICNNEFPNYLILEQFMKQKLNATVSLFEEESIVLEQAESVILSHFAIKNPGELSLEDKACGVQALGGLILYLNQTQKDGARRITGIRIYTEEQYMNIDITARRNLELTESLRAGERRGTLLWVLDKTKTAMGKRYMRKSLEQPLVNLAHITRRQNAVKELFEDSITLREIQENLSGIYDLERLMTRVLYGSANPREIRSLATTARRLPAIKELTRKFRCDLLGGIHRDIDIMEDICNLVENAIEDNPPYLLKDGGYIREGFHENLDELRGLCTNAREIMEKIEIREREATGIKNLKIKYNKVFGYYLEVTNSNLGMVPEHYIRKQTLTGSERYITEELKDLEVRILSASGKSIALENEIFHEIRKYIASRLDTIQRTAGAVAQLDFLASLAMVAQRNDYACPEITTDGTIDIKNGRHPVVEQMLDDSLFVPNDVFLDTGDNRMAIITGPNMAGKSTYMRQVAVITVMAQVGSFVPASEAKVSIVDRMFTRVGASDDLASGQSTFMVEMSEVAHILKNATSRSLIILDEIGRGTSTFDGMSIAKAVVEHIVSHKRLKCKTLFATHYHELTSLEEELDGVKNYNIAVKKRGDEITFLRKIIPGGADDSYGIEVAKLAGIPEKVVSRAKEILKELEGQNGVVRIVKETRETDSQMGFTSYTNEIEERLKLTALETLTPIEALNMLYELKKLL